MMGGARQWAVAGYLGAALGGSTGLAACSGAHEPTQGISTVPRGAIIPTANVPALLGASIEELRARLGTAQPLPTGSLDSLSATTASADSVLAFRLGGLGLVATYNVQTRQVLDLLVLGQHEDSIMGRASLRSSAREYLVLPVFRPDNPNRLLGLRVVATTQHK